jgi:hypothetical protein
MILAASFLSVSVSTAILAASSPSVIVSTVIAATAACGSLLAALGAVLKGFHVDRKVAEVHVLVNRRLDKALAEIENLKGQRDRQLGQLEAQEDPQDG